MTKLQTHHAKHQHTGDPAVRSASVTNVDERDEPRVPPSAGDDVERLLSIFGVRVSDMTRPAALALLERSMRVGDGRCRSVFFVNAHTLNLTTDQPSFRQVLNAADVVFNDGTGVRWAARQRGIAVRDNLNGTDLIPAFFAGTKGNGYRFFLLGTKPDSIAAAAQVAAERFDGWQLAGCHHGYVHNGGSDAVIDQINASGADLLLVGMGNPLQEHWIHDHRARLKVPLAVGVGGLFDYWAGSLERAPNWVRKLGSEWVHLLIKQPHKAQRYLLGNPKFLYRMTRCLRSDLANMKAWAAIDNDTVVTSPPPGGQADLDGSSSRAAAARASPS